MNPDSKLFVRDLAMLLGVPAILLAGLVMWWKPWVYRRALIRPMAFNERELNARKADVRSASWHGMTISVPAVYVLVVEDSVLEVIEREPSDSGTGTRGAHLAFVLTTPARHARFADNATNCSLAPGRCWTENEASGQLDCQRAAGIAEPEFWWTPQTVCEAPASGVWVAMNAPDAQQQALWELAKGALTSTARGP